MSLLPFTDFCMPCILIVITFSMSMLNFIEDNKRNEHWGGGGVEFSRKLKILKKIYISSFDIIFMI